ncbi:MAG: MATE family efflux transporter [Christensenellaceae bacterium]|nr:MATE family efflux transporter [Christensenellaceae bacterium]
MQLIRDRHFYALLISLALPLALQDLIKFGLNLMDNIMVGALGEVSLSAVSLANQPFFLFSMFCFGLAGGGTVLITQYFGKNDMASVRRVVSITVSITLTASVLIGALVLLFPRAVMSIYTPDPDLIAIGAEYLKITGWTYFLFGVSNTLVLMLRSVQVVRITLVANCLSFVTNVFLNWVLIFGKLGAPALGVKGAAIATLSARALEFVILLLYVRFFDKKLAFRLRSLFHFHPALTKDFLHYSTPVLFNEFGWGLGISLISVVLGRLGTDAVAAGSIASTVQQVATVFIFGVCNAACIMVGKDIGAGNIERAKRTAHTLLAVSMTLGMVLGTALFLLRPAVLSLYDLSASTRAMSMSFLIVTSCIVFVDSVSTLAIVGVLRGGGDTRYSMLVDVLTLWLLSIPAGMLAGLVFKWDPILVYVILRSDVLLKAILCFRRVVSNKWVHSVTRDLSPNK